MTKTDARLWKEYGGDGNGACVEIDIPDHLVGQNYHRVCYVLAKVFHIDTFLESALFPDKIFQTYQNMLLTKTKKVGTGRRDSVHRQSAECEPDF